MSVKPSLSTCICACVLMVAGSTAFCGRGSIDPATLRKDRGVVVVAKLENIKSVQLKERNIVSSGYSFDIHIEDVLLGEMTPSPASIHVEYSPAGYGTTWEALSETGGYGQVGETNNPPPDGTKAIVLLHPHGDNGYSVYGMPGSIVVIDSFEDPRVEMWKLIGTLWGTDDPGELRQMLLRGLASDNALYRDYCADAIFLPRMSFSGLELEDVFSSQELQSLALEQFDESPRPANVLLASDNYLRQSFDDELHRTAWITHSKRLTALLRSVEETSSKTTTRKERLDAHLAIIRVVRSQQYRDESIAAIADLFSEADNQRSLVLQSWAGLYYVGGANEELLKGNVAILKQLQEEARVHDDDSWAEQTLRQIAKMHVEMGADEAQMGQIADALRLVGVAPSEVEEFRNGVNLRRETLQGFGVVELVSWPHDGLLGKQIALRAFGGLHKSEGARSGSYFFCQPTDWNASGPAVWLESARPEGQVPSNEPYFIVSGTLVERRDVPVPAFLNESDLSFLDKHDFASRYVLENAHVLAMPE
jgi:hypothetical protein